MFLHNLTTVILVCYSMLHCGKIQVTAAAQVGLQPVVQVLVRYLYFTWYGKFCCTVQGCFNFYICRLNVVCGSFN